MNDKIQAQYQRWLALADASLQPELAAMAKDEALIEDAFYRDLAFGTGGLRGVIGPGTNRMNIHTVEKASQGIADYVIKHFEPDQRRIAISYDSRILSDVFARRAAAVFAANGIQAFIYPQLMPTPCLSWAVRDLGCAAGVMITASHNPAKYNGYKVYGADGCQITTEAAVEILAEIEKLDLFEDIRRVAFEDGLADGSVSWIPGAVYDRFTEAVKAQSLLTGETVDKDVAIVYTPLNGTGLKPVLRALDECGYTRVTVVAEQEQPDGHFPTCPYPNPEIREAMALGIDYAEKTHADLLMATDPDCDRCGIAVRDRAGEYRLLSGNETGLLLLDYVCARREATGRMPKDPVLVKTIVTTDLADRIAAAHGVKTINVLTGFKFIGEQIGLLEKQGQAERYIFGFEESYGYLSGTHVRDKDAVNAALMIADMFVWLRAQGKSLLDRLAELYAEYGYCLNTLHSYTFEGAAGFDRMQAIMAAFRAVDGSLAGYEVEQKLDYLPGLDGLPASDVLKFRLKGGSSVVVRPSGTEPKLKLYGSITAKGSAEATALEASLVSAIEKDFGLV